MKQYTVSEVLYVEVMVSVDVEAEDEDDAADKARDVIQELKVTLDNDAVSQLDHEIKESLDTNIECEEEEDEEI